LVWHKTQKSDVQIKLITLGTPNRIFKIGQ
jgi:hypothetical protein